MATILLSRLCGRDVGLESRTWTRVQLKFRFLGLGLETCALETCGLGLGLATYGLALEIEIRRFFYLNSK